jgi:hypothetical protein
VATQSRGRRFRAALPQQLERRLATGAVERLDVELAAGVVLRATQGTPYGIAGVEGSRYQDFRPYPDGSVAYAAPGSASTKIKIVRVSPCK